MEVTGLRATGTVGLITRMACEDEDPRYPRGLRNNISASRKQEMCQDVVTRYHKINISDIQTFHVYNCIAMCLISLCDKSGN